MRVTLRLELMEVRLNPAIRVDLVALHEFGHALGLDHSSDPNSIMYPYYNANYNLSNFANDSAVATFQSIYSGPNTGPWKDSLDPHKDNGQVEITYSFIPDGARMDKGSNNLFSTFNKLAPTSTWQAVFTAQLTRWASVSNNKVAFTVHSDTGLNFNYSGLAQNDTRSGDIRIGSHRFDGTGKVLAHTYFPPPNGSTAAGDSHYDSSEAWTLSGGSAPLSGGGRNGGGGGGGNLMLGGPVVPSIFLAPTPAIPSLQIASPISSLGVSSGASVTSVSATLESVHAWTNGTNNLSIVPTRASTESDKGDLDLFGDRLELHGINVETMSF